VVESREAERLFVDAREEGAGRETRRDDGVAVLYVYLAADDQVCVVASEWAGDDAAQLREAINRALARERGRGPEAARSRDADEVCVQVVRARLCDDVDGAARRATILGAGGVRQDCELLYGRERDVREDGLTAPSVVGCAPVERDGRLPPPAAVDDEEEVVEEQVARPARGAHSRVQFDEVRHLAAQDRRVVNLLKVESRAELRRVGLQALGRAEDRDLARPARDRERHVERGGLARAQLDAADLLCGEAPAPDSEFITPRQRQTRDGVEAFAVGLRVAAESRQFVRDDDLRVRDGRLVLIEHLAADGRRVVRLRAEQRCAGESHGEQRARAQRGGRARRGFHAAKVFEAGQFLILFQVGLVRQPGAEKLLMIAKLTTYYQHT